MLPPRPPDVTTNRRAFLVLVRNELFRRVQLMALQRDDDLAGHQPDQPCPAVVPDGQRQHRAGQQRGAVPGSVRGRFEQAAQFRRRRRELELAVRAVPQRLCQGADEAAGRRHQELYFQRRNPILMTKFSKPALVASLLIAAATAQPAFPVRPIRVVIPFGPGGGTDNLVRILEPYVTRALGQRNIVAPPPGCVRSARCFICLPAASICPFGILTLLVDGLPVVWRCFLSWGAMKVEVAPESSHANGS